MGKYTFEVKPFNLDYNGLEARMYDKFTNAYTTLSTSSNTKFDFNITSDAASKVLDRFKIVFTQAAHSPFSFTKLEALRNADKSIGVNWSVENEYSIAKYDVEHSIDGIVFKKLTSADALELASGKASYLSADANPALKETNYYRIKATGYDASIVYSKVVNIEAEKIVIIKPLISVFPNPVKDGVANLSFTAQKAGKYSVIIYDNLGQVVSSSNIKIADAQQTVKINVPAAKAIYTMVITKPDGGKETINLVVQ